MKKKFLFLPLLFVTVLVLTFYFLRPNAESQIAKAFNFFKQNELAKAEALIQEANELCGDVRCYLYLGYLEQYKERFSQSNAHFQRYLKNTKTSQDQSDAYIGLSINAFFEKKDADFFIYAEKAIHANPAKSQFLQALLYYKQQHYSDALKVWHVPKDTKDSWHAVALRKHFPASWKNIHEGHCLIELKQQQRARELLENELHQSGQVHDLACCFLGLSYLKEAEAYSNRDSFYKMARFYFGQCQSELFFREHQELTKYVESEALQLLLSGNHPDWAFEFMAYLNQWQAYDSLDLIASKLVEKMAHQNLEHGLELSAQLKTALNSTYFHTIVYEKLSHKLNAAIKSAESEKFLKLWQLLHVINDIPSINVREMACLTVEEIYDTIKHDNLKLEKTRSYVRLWQQMEKSTEDEELLAQELLYNAKLFWQNESQELKGLYLMEMALELTQNKELLQQHIFDFLNTLHFSAVNSHLVRRQMLIYEALEHFGYYKPDILTREALANYLADAAYLFDVRNFNDALSQASLVLKFDPQNEKALFIAGLSAFNLGAYMKASLHLKELKNPDENVNRALQLSQAFASQESCLCQSNADFSNESDSE